MESALYDPHRGYYMRHIHTVGRHGDFSTSATLSTALGEAVATWIKAERGRQPAVRTLIEIGGGDGSLALSVLRHLGWWNRTRLRFCMVERSPVLRDQQARKLARYGVRWF